MSSAQRLQNLSQSVIRQMTRLAQEHDAINLSQGFPDFDPPQEVLAAAIHALTNGVNQYSITWGNARLRAQIADNYARWYNLDFDPHTDITITCGVTEAIIASLMGVVNTGDSVIILDPCHENYLPGITFAGATPIWLSLAPPDYSLDEQMARAAFAKKPKAIILNSPHNPTGRVFSRETLQLIADLCIEHDTIAITDEIYEHILYDGRLHIPIASLPGMAEYTITISGLTKTYAGTGWRVAWAVAPPHLSEALRTTHDFLTICAPAPLQEAAITALQLPASFYVKLTEGYTERRAKMMSILEEVGFGAIYPEGAYYVMADYSRINSEMDDISFAKWLTSEKRVAVVPGSSFYKDNPALGQGYVRFAFPKQISTLEEAGRRMLG